MTESIAEEVKEKGININAIMPSIIDTQANRQSMPEADFSKWVLKLAQRVPRAFYEHLGV